MPKKNFYKNCNKEDQNKKTIKRIRNILKKIRDMIHRFVKQLNDVVEKPVNNLILSSVILAIMANLLSNSFEANSAYKQMEEKRLQQLSNINIGTSKEWMDDTFGVPQFTGNPTVSFSDDKSKSLTYTCCAYISDYYVLQAVYDEYRSLQAYLVTLLNHAEDIEVEITCDPFRSNDYFALGDTSYYDLFDKPIYVTGFNANGGRMLYAEAYSYEADINHYDYYYATLDFGKLDTTVQDFFENLTEANDIDDEVALDIISGSYVIADRKVCFPNTFGVSYLDRTTTTALLLSYDWFDSLQLRNRLNPPAG